MIKAMPQPPASWQEYLPWLRRLRWLDPFEPGMCWANLGAGVLVLLVWIWRTGPGFGALLLLTHLVLLLTVVLWAKRGWAPAWLGLILVSMLNCLFVAVAGQFPLRLLAWAYFGLGLVGLALACWGWLRLRLRLSALAHIKHRDDFRWLVTASPIAARWWVQRLVRQGQPQPD